VKKAMAIGGYLLSFFLFLLLWFSWSCSLELIINNEMVVFLMLKVVMARGRRLKKGGGDLEVHKQNVALSKQTIGKQNVDPLQPRLGEQNVAPSKLRIDESTNLCGLELTMVTVWNSNGEMILNIDWECRNPNLVKCGGEAQHLEKWGFGVLRDS
jgi:hypothetical protein